MLFILKDVGGYPFSFQLNHLNIEKYGLFLEWWAENICSGFLSSHGKHRFLDCFFASGFLGEEDEAALLRLVWND